MALLKVKVCGRMSKFRRDFEWGAHAESFCSAGTLVDCVTGVFFILFFAGTFYCVLTLSC